MRIKTLTVSEVNNYIKKTLDVDFILNNLSIKGEISNLKYHTSGHIYFSLKDSVSKINCVMFRDRANELTFSLKEGIDVIVSGRCSMYTGNGSVQIYVETLLKNGVGELHLEFEKLKKRLAKEGYFDEEYKKEIPLMPLRIGVITSETGAVIQDIINVSRRRSSLVDIVLYPAQVQGVGAYKSIIKGLKFFNNKKNVDAIILGRGGGSIEELWNFNEEDLVKEIFKSKIPVISAVGHETDFTISDFVADLRASTPSHAAEIVVPLENELTETVSQIKSKFDAIMLFRFEKEKVRLKNLNKILMLNSPQNTLKSRYYELEVLRDKLDNIIRNKVSIEKDKLKSINNLLQAYNPVNILDKGYAIVENGNKNIITSKNQFLDNKDKIRISFKDGTIEGQFVTKK